MRVGLTYNIFIRTFKDALFYVFQYVELFFLAPDYRNSSIINTLEFTKTHHVLALSNLILFVKVPDQGPYSELASHFSLDLRKKNDSAKSP